MIFAWFVVAYLTLVWVAMRLIVPNFGFTKKPLPDLLPQELAARIKQVHSESTSNHDFLKRTYDFVTSKYKGSRVRTVTNFWVAFQNPLTHPAGFMPCTNQNYLLRAMLVKSGRFQESDVLVKVMPFNLFIHQYLRVKVDGKWIDVDPWSSYLGVPLGKRSSYIG